MGVDLNIITGHSFDYTEIINLQERIEIDGELKNLFWLNKNDNIICWNKIADYKRLEKAWVNNENQVEVHGVYFFDDLCFPTFFGDIQIHRHIIKLPGFGLKLWTMETDSVLRRDILSFYRRLGDIFNQKVFIYFGDSYANSSWIEDLIYSKSIEDILEEIEKRSNESIDDINKSIISDHLYIQKIKAQPLIE
jgi:hypothetical protein